MAIVRCPECDGKVSDNAHTCPHCGVSLGTCCECGGLLKLFEEECPHCGASLTWNNSDKDDEDKNKKEGGCLEQFVGCLAFVIIFIIILFCISLCGNSDSDNKKEKTEQNDVSSNVSNNVSSDVSNNVNNNVSNNEDKWSEMTFALDATNALGEKTYSKFEVTLYADGTASTAYTDLDGRSGTVDCEWNLNDATYHNECAEMYLVDITINGTNKSHAFRKGTNDAYFFYGSIIQTPEKLGNMTLGEDKKFVKHYKIIRKK